MPSTTDPYRWISDQVSRDPTRVVIRGTAGGDISYGTLDAVVGRMAAALAELGVTAGDRVATQVDKSVASIYLYLACLRIGAVYVPINTANTAAEVEYFLGDSSPKIAIVRPQDHAALAPAALAAGVSHLLTLDAAGQGSFADYLSVCATSAFAPAPVDLPAGALASIVYTSGTTGRSKGAMLTRGNLASNSVTLAAAWHFSADDVLLHTLPLFHVHGLFAALNTVLAAGASLIVLPGFDAPTALGLLPSATVFMGVPTYYTRFLQLPELSRERTASIRLFVSGSAPLLAETHREFEARTGHVILERYGMTETLMNASNPYEGRRLPGAVGPALPGVEIRIVKPDTDQTEVTRETVGAIEVRGPNVCAGYWGAPEKTRLEFREDGWFKTGDVGRIDVDGYLHIVGRAKDLVITGGYNVYPKEVETEIDAIPGVIESAVIGVPHPDFGEGVTAVVVLGDSALDERTLIASLQTRLARYKVPKRVLIVAELPRNAMGKVQKNVLRARFAKLYEDP